MQSRNFVAFGGQDLLVRGSALDLAPICADFVRTPGTPRLAVFDDVTGRVLDVDWTQEEKAIVAQLQPGHPKKRGPGRPKLGVISREISLLPEHWEWLAAQSGGASATLRRLVHAARTQGAEAQKVSTLVSAAHAFLSDIAGDLPDYEEVLRALYASRFEELEALTTGWPPGIIEQLERFIARR